MVKSIVFAFATATLAVLASSVSDAAPLMRRAASGQTGALISATEYCLFLPPVAGGDIAKSEDDAVAFCNTAIASAPNARPLPEGFVQKVNFVKNEEKGYVQITGTINPAAYKLAASDEGGQYDNRAPVGAVCAGYSSFVQITEPQDGRFCLRCCKNKGDCPVNKSEFGCETVLGGVY
ncbi:hypothetical protein BGZ70_003959 [Mortierella alpina]|uniref:Uncharacterized protein n=1 Tax=Mortierella alpina TaxID=64518 RepID=A0A9P6M541_MORAP|nr:hypothetical protein BGZ70_003959 [Mortierella alpina]